jgi:hypothetical protein
VRRTDVGRLKWCGIIALLGAAAASPRAARAQERKGTDLVSSVMARVRTLFSISAQPKEPGATVLKPADLVSTRPDAIVAGFGTLTAKATHAASGKYTRRFRGFWRSDR